MSDELLSYVDSLISIPCYENMKRLFTIKKLEYIPWPSNQSVQISVSGEVRWEWVVVDILENN